jgi:putative transposase
LKTKEKRALIMPDHPKISISRQCELLSLSRGAYYYDPRPLSEEGKRFMDLIDREYTAHPFKGSRRLKDHLEELGHRVSRDRVRRLMRLLGIEAVYPKPRLSIRNKKHAVYPYLLRNTSISLPDQVWCSDITYIRLQDHFAYLTVVMDWHSRYVLSWKLSPSLESGFCIDALSDALQISTPDIFNTDQGSQYTCGDFIEMLKSADIQISMDGKGRAFDNIMVERLWRTLKYEEVYLRDYTDFYTAQDYLGNYILYYNQERRHSSLGKRTPSEVYWQGREQRKAG